MANKSLKIEVDKVDPMFNIPDGINELEYDEDSPSDLTLIQDPDGNFIYVPTTPPPVTQYGLPAPNILGIIGQTIRTTKSGAQVVDVEIEVEDIPGATYEIRVNKL